MKDLSALIWLTQLGLGVAVPPAVLVLLALWLRERYGLGIWVVILAAILGLCSAIASFRHSLKTMERLSRDKKKKSPPPVAFNDHD